MLIKLPCGKSFFYVNPEKITMMTQSRNDERYTHLWLQGSDDDLTISCPVDEVLEILLRYQVSKETLKP